MKAPVIGLTLGDPAGVGPEIILRTLKEVSSLPEARFVIFGQRKILETWGRHLGLAPDLLPVALAGGNIELRETGSTLEGLEPGSPTAAGAQASFDFFREAVEAAARDEIQAMVTAPVSKDGWHKAGIKYRGHTEYLESLYPEAMMTFWSRRLKLALFTHHLPLREAISRVRRQNLVSFFRTLGRHLVRWNLGVEEILVCGLNPHAGENGALGIEEIQEIVPAVAEARSEGLNLTGPFPPDTIFLKALDSPGKMVVSLYHDQALIAFKLLSFEQGVNLTLGLPFIRTSPDHGTAFDLAGKGLASLESFREAVWLAWKLASGQPG
ncbi:MAG: 4-hydroxythreonine-4-phosphate dehydrogenase [Candidatus Saccharicenans subterraneus]|uniref:4-hydroxythreonine-4-phosphate dehydrogenase n=1 Tax=Candidatus Saccharicenans subterraneus TaxID=2508984 RepID=A0A3E2BQ22_9BACT|nr:MAG: 4-hydroxythreonine-4-phosphate dehydrogenase [Candidatus Saccharicenans subterraneum]